MGVDWLNALQGVGGRLVPAARAFAGSDRPSFPGRGPHGVRWLAHQLDRFVDQDTDDAQDARFVEGAGALLGLLLIDHLGGRARERDGCHRVQLGRFGWFDPFAAVQDALDADDPRACLSQYLALAERESLDDGPVSRIVGAFAETLGQDRPDLGIESHFELTVELNNGAIVDLARLERISRDQDHAATLDAARRIISMLPGADSQRVVPWQEAACRLLPRLVSTQFLESLPDEQCLYAEPLGHDVCIAMQLRYSARARFVRQREVDEWAVAGEAPQHAAICNLAERSQSLRIEPVTEDIFRARQGDGLDGARLLLPDLAARLTRLGDEPWIAAVPHRDVLLLARQTCERELRDHACDAARRAPHPVSSAVFLIGAHGPRPLRRSKKRSH